jgi:hypothetical protein
VSQQQTGGAARRWAVGPLAGLLLVAGVCTAAIPAQRSLAAARDRVVAAAMPATPDAAHRAAAARLRGVRTLLAARAGALLRHDRAGWLAGIDPAATALRARQAALLANIAAVPLATWRYTVDPGDRAGRTDRAGSWTVRVTLEYALRDADPAPTSRPLVLTFADRHGRWLISADDRAAADGSTTWRGPWVADSVDTGRERALGQRIVVNPANIDRLGALGRRVVLEHEATHLATRGVTGPKTPIWLVVGLADWVGYRGSGLSPYQVADELHAALGTGRWPGRLPVAADFTGDSPRLALAYEEAWSACRLIADRAGPAALLRLYRAVGTAADPAAALDAQLRTTLHASTAQFTMLWRRSVLAEFR